MHWKTLDHLPQTVSKSSKNHCLTVLLQTSITTPRKDDSMLSSAPSHSSLAASTHSQSHHSSVSGLGSHYATCTRPCITPSSEPFTALSVDMVLTELPARGPAVCLNAGAISAWVSWISYVFSREVFTRCSLTSELFFFSLSLPRNQLLLRDPGSKFRNTQFLNECA